MLSDASGPTPQGPQPRSATPLTLKIVVAGGFGAGKTTLIGSVSEIEPLATEEILTRASEGVDRLDGTPGKTTTTVSMDYGRITFEEPMCMRLQLFGTPGQDRFLFTWPDLAYGASGAVILADTRRLTDSFTAVDYFTARATPFVVAVNQFADRRYDYTTDEVREALDLPEHVPILLCDARQEISAARVLISLVDHALKTAPDRRPSTLGA
ncbi:GTP-binding protein [Streptomyces nanshensis]|uniref:ATP-binding protein n=1 Tax=Streptomyces nanshensis TaxID=518642 RepID=A0A1E7L9Y1_9ACTN|nr:ATP/GTP-binding protein [Streptomyces nanshensis]OEV13009.1 ATP-binding protein [Streptomyces nanshensis]